MKALIQDRVLRIFLIITGVLFITAVVLLMAHMASFSYPLILHFDVYEGVDVTGSLITVWSTLGAILLLCIINGVVAGSVFMRERILAYFLLGANMLLTLLAVLHIGQIVSLN